MLNKDILYISFSYHYTFLPKTYLNKKHTYYSGDNMKIKEIAFFGYSVTNMQKSKAFYEGVLGLKPARTFSDTFIEYDIGSATLAIGVGSPFKPNSGGGSVAFEVENFDETLAHLKKHNVTFVFEPQDFGVCQMVAISDPDGNTLMIHRKK